MGQLILDHRANPINPTKLIITPVQGASVSGAHPDFWPAVLVACTRVGNLVVSNKTLSVKIGWDEVHDGVPVTGAALSFHTSSANFTFAQIRSALIANAVSANALQAVSTLPASNPSPGGASDFWNIPPPQAYMLGLSGAPVAPYAWAGFSAGVNWNYTETPGASEYDIVGTICHEITEILFGRIMQGQNFYMVPDLYRYSDAGVRKWSGSGGYFSIDGGQTNLKDFDASGGDKGDWANSGSPDAFDTSAGPNVGQSMPVSAVDQILIDVLGLSSQ